MASLNKLAIRGIRSFDDKQISVIEFFSPVTVIVGHNGSGKTTIIECLKYATTGDQPPNTRGGAFVHDPKMANEKEVKAQVKLRFHAANGTRMLAVRNLSVTVRKTTGFTMKTLESILALADGNAEKGGKRGVISTKCAEIDTEIPQLLGVSKSVLENVIFCHQEDSYWPLAEASTLKKKFDDIFEATRYTKALDSIKALRKERVAEGKVDNERLKALLAEKNSADKLKADMAKLSSTIATKEVQYEDIKSKHDELVVSNRRFYESATKFRELYITIGNLEDKKKRHESDLVDAKLNLQEVVGSDDELNMRLKNFDDHINTQRQKKRIEDTKKQDLEDELVNTRKYHTELLQQHGILVAEAEVQKRRIHEREQLIHETGEKYGIRGYSHSPLERDKVVEFLTRLGDFQRKQKSEHEKFQLDLRHKGDDYMKKARQLDNILDGHKRQKMSLRERITEHQSSIALLERELETKQALPSEHQALLADIDEKKARLSKIKSDIQAAKYDSRMNEKIEKSRILEDRRDELNAELRSLSLQADSRARLELRRGEIKVKSAEVQSSVDLANAKLRKLTGREVTVNDLEAEIDHITLVKEQQRSDQEHTVHTTNNVFQKAESVLANLKAQFGTKKKELEALEAKLVKELEHKPLDVAIKEAMEELDYGKKLAGSMIGGTTVYESLLRVGRQKKLCGACNRHLNDEEMAVFETYLKDLMKKTSPESIKANERETAEWEQELQRLQSLRPVQVTRDQLKTVTLPDLEKQIQIQEEEVPHLSQAAEEALTKLNEIKEQLKDVLMLKQYAATITRLNKELNRAADEVRTLESDLASTGSTKTADDVQIQLDNLATEIRANDRDKQNVTAERERHNTTIRTLETKLHGMELNERDLNNQIKDKIAVEEKIESMKTAIVSFANELKGTDAKISEAQAPIDALEAEHAQIKLELNGKISQSQILGQELNMSIDKLTQINKNLYRYVREKGARNLEVCAEQIEQADAKLQDIAGRIEVIREEIAKIDKEINESGASVANLRENIRVRRLVKDIKETQAQIDSYDMEEAARSKRKFEELYNVEKERERRLQASYSHIAGELSAHKSQMKKCEHELDHEYKGVNKKYTDQLIKVKMSDMANEDLEKYAKALDNAIMKYHGLKMEEVNDTMKHLWNKTYQGTDIDGIKIRSDVEGGSSKRSYNYRVVMTKDQVEMDMRGRCSAGQKMLASIIIRLALSDSFGQNCGILALDEPTNALDTENIDALAASLVDIINERKNHSNFQLIIITHDENFLRKLGQNDVMEYYWRVSRDSRQKSVIERQRFR
ncbi:hypothetical protein BD779DRAFT_1640508 [Infundibulicybe gibba]|nr:hypothetical protein BD779DRAFT_1640508 [Infundibulicybe gibba]